MKKLTPVILAVALALSILGVLGTRIYQAAAYGGAAPEILFDSEVISVPTGADDAALLAGVTATDAEDGDVTASLVVEGISGRNDDGTVRVTYAVFDSNHHVTKATRAVRYTDYVKPRFALTQPLVCRTGGNRVLSSYVTAHDSIDGDLSGRVKIALTDERDDLADELDEAKTRELALTQRAQMAEADVEELQGSLEDVEAGKKAAEDAQKAAEEAKAAAELALEAAKKSEVEAAASAAEAAEYARQMAETYQKVVEIKAELMKPEYQSSYSKLTEIQNEIDSLEEEILIDMEAWEELSSQLEALG